MFHLKEGTIFIKSKSRDLSFRPSLQTLGVLKYRLSDSHHKSPNFLVPDRHGMIGSMVGKNLFIDSMLFSLVYWFDSSNLEGSTIFPIGYRFDGQKIVIASHAFMGHPYNCQFLVGRNGQAIIQRK